MHKIFRTEQDFQKFHQSNTKSIGFVPTMGNLHNGHLSLLKQAFEETEVIVLSIFVNPEQFAPGEDFSEYPRTFQEDLEKALHIYNDFPKKEFIVFYPQNENVIYPEGFNDYVYTDSLGQILEGEIRPTFFNGVATVVKRLFKIVRPQIAYFGKKDFQQLKIVERMVLKERLHITIKGMPIIREDDGLAMSSRNGYLDLNQKKEALKLYNALNEIAFSLKFQGIKKAQYKLNQLKEDIRFNYLEIRDPHSLEPVDDTNTEAVILGNFQLGNTKLLDNLEVNFYEL